MFPGDTCFPRVYVGLMAKVSRMDNIRVELNIRSDALKSLPLADLIGL